jgi:hypothetical protein
MTVNPYPDGTPFSSTTPINYLVPNLFWNKTFCENESVSTEAGHFNGCNISNLALNASLPTPPAKC